jgi:uncharacterized protein involved in exopolysaccharide biosynthesis
MRISPTQKLIGFVLSVGLLTGLVWMLTPDVYEANTLILVDPQKVPERFVATTVSMDTLSRLDTINQQLMSSTRLQRIIDTYDLYRPMKGHYTQEEIIQEFRSNIRVEGLSAGPNGHSFRIYYRGHSPALVAQVTNQLASLFIEENLKVREQQAEGTSEFIDIRLDLTRKRLREAEVAARQIKDPIDRSIADRELAALRTQFDSLLTKKMEADMAVDLEKRQKSERFTILDPARIPEKPLSRFTHAGFGY